LTIVSTAEVQAISAAAGSGDVMGADVVDAERGERCRAAVTPNHAGETVNRRASPAGRSGRRSAV
jgi:hypothetical protein